MSDLPEVTGYAGKPLAQKLGFAPGDSVFVEDTPDWYSEFADENRFDLDPGLPATHAHMFFSRKAELVSFLKDNDLEDIEKSLWLSWPKKTSGLKTDLSENDIREAVLGWPGFPSGKPGWVDVKVAAIDDTWSALKFLRRKK